MRPYNPRNLLALRAAVAAVLGLPGLLTGCDATVVCETPVDNGNGLETCSNGLVTRPNAPACDSSLPRGAATCAQNPVTDTCATDADCTAQTNGYCDVVTGFDGISCTCSYGCTTDDECGAGAVCICGDPVGHCETGTCGTNDDCPEGQLCANYGNGTTGCTGEGWACTTSADECISNADCLQAEACTYDGTKRACTATHPCGTGRPFLVAGSPRVAPLVRSADWCARVEVDSSVLGDDTRAALAARWAEIGLLEHASIAAFARFALQLLALGAPSELVEQAHAAMADETRHARLAFGLSARYGAIDVGPGPLRIDGAFEGAAEADELLRIVFREGCVGETIAAIEAAEGARLAADPAVRSILAQIGEDETRHALLAWASIAWLLAVIGDRAIGVLEDELDREIATLPNAHEGADLRVHGLLQADDRDEIRRQALTMVIAPAVHGLRTRPSRPLRRRIALEPAVEGRTVEP